MELSAEQTAIRDTVREVALEEIRPIAAEADREAAFPEAVWDTLADLGMTAMTVPEEYDGLDLEMTAYSIVNEEVAYGALAVATALGVHALATSCLAEFGDEVLKEEVREHLLSFEEDIDRWHVDTEKVVENVEAAEGAEVSDDQVAQDDTDPRATRN